MYQIEHYVNEGAEHFLLLDDGSTDGSHQVLKTYIDRGLVTMMVDERKHHNPPIGMVERYNILFKPFHYLTTWMLHVDLDEFVYGRKGTVADYLRGVASDVGEIRLAWKMFGSSGYIHKPKHGVAKSFVHRSNFTVVPSMTLHTKPIFRTKAFEHEDAHWVALKPGFRSGFPLDNFKVGPNLTSWPVPEEVIRQQIEWSMRSDEVILETLQIHINHYCVRWKDWFMKVKATRGIADRDVSVYDANYFAAYDVNTILDAELAQVKKRGKWLNGITA